LRERPFNHPLKERKDQINYLFLFYQGVKRFGDTGHKNLGARRIVNVGWGLILMAVVAGTSIASAQNLSAAATRTHLDSSPSSSTNVDVDFATVVKPYLKEHCIKCHGPEKKKGKLVLHTIGNDLDTDAGSERWIDILDQLIFDEMPPEEEDRPRSEDTAQVAEWIKRRLEEAGKAEGYIKKLLAPEYGNWVNHEKLFSGKIKTMPYSPSRLWRLSPDIFKQKGFHGRSPFTFTTSDHGFRDYSDLSPVDQSTLQMLMINADKWLDQRQGKNEFKRFADDQPAPTDKELVDTVHREFQRIMQRQPSREEESKYAAFLARNIEIGGNLEGFRTTVKTMFLSPEAIYRMEFGLGETDEHGRRHLAPEEMAYAIAYALTDNSPQRLRPTREAMAQGKLVTKEDAARVVGEILDEGIPHEHWNSTRLPRVMRFFNEYFGLHHALTVFKDEMRRNQADIGFWHAEGLMFDAKQIILHHLKKDQNFIEEILTTDQYFVAHPGDNAYAKKVFEEKNGRVINGIRQYPEFGFSEVARGIGDLSYIRPYNLPGTRKKEEQIWNWPIEQPIKMVRRAGILTHPAWLTAHSFNDGNDPIHRGIWVRSKLLAGVIQDVPPNVDAQVPANPHKTLKERMEVVREERCWSCHQKFNPLGETFEMFDDWGRYRDEFYFDKDAKLVTRRDKAFTEMQEQKHLTSRPVDATGAITDSGDPKVDGKVNDAVEMMQRIGRSDRARQSFIRHLFRYFMGRNEMLSDSKTLIEAERAYIESGGSFKMLVVSLLSSDSFLYRR
jgi:hypothetical protein